ncbi:MAG: hypothetical protein NTX16_12865 [Actinobacteria bacterium]|nr:hypothetical protein [Actinomycetota bacterium]
MEQIAPHIYRWTAPHPEWRSSVEEVVSYALVDGEALNFVDPLLPAEGDARRAPLLADIDTMIGEARRLDLFVTIPYHTRSVETLYERYSRTVPTLIWGHPTVKKRLTRKAPFEVIPQSSAGEAAEIADGAVLAYTIGKPRRAEYPLYFPGLRTVAFGDAIVGTQGGLRFWNQGSSTGADWYRDVFAATLRPLAAQDIEYVLTTHGPAVLADGRRALEECLAAPPVDLY